MAYSFTEKKRLDDLPGLIAKLESEIGKLNTLLADPELFTREPVKFRKASEMMAERQGVLAAAEEEEVAAGRPYPFPETDVDDLNGLVSTGRLNDVVVHEMMHVVGMGTRWGARGILADTAHHPESLVILAARVIAGQTDNASECSDAIDLLCQLDRRPLHTIAAAAFPKGGAA